MDLKKAKSRLRPGTTRERRPEPGLSILMPAFNEEAGIARAISQLLATDFGVPFELIVINDGSRDRTLQEASRAARNHPEVKVISREKNAGKGAALRLGACSASGRLVIIQDADLEYDPREIPRLLAALSEGGCGAVYGSRFLGRTRGMSAAHLFGNRFLTLATNLLFGSRLTDMETCYKLMPRSTWNSLALTRDRFEFEGEVTAELLRRGHRIREVPISYKARGYELGKKINWVDGIKTFATLLGCRLRR